MREIKFRAWHKEEKNMYTWPFIIHHFDDEIRVTELDRSGYKTIPMNQIELMQYTGLKDSQGREIYEGDILETSTRNGLDVNGRKVSHYSQVKFGIVNDPGGYDEDDYVWNGFYTEDIGITRDGVRDKDYGTPSFRFALVENKGKEGIIVGNIYENTELL